MKYPLIALFCMTLIHIKAQSVSFTVGMNQHQFLTTQTPTLGRPVNLGRIGNNLSVTYTSPASQRLGIGVERVNFVKRTGTRLPNHDFTIVDYDHFTYLLNISYLPFVLEPLIFDDRSRIVINFGMQLDFTITNGIYVNINCDDLARDGDNNISYRPGFSGLVNANYGYKLGPSLYLESNANFSIALIDKICDKSKGPLHLALRWDIGLKFLLNTKS